MSQALVIVSGEVGGDRQPFEVGGSELRHGVSGAERLVRLAPRTLLEQIAGTFHFGICRHRRALLATDTTVLLALDCGTAIYER